MMERHDAKANVLPNGRRLRMPQHIATGRKMMTLISRLRRWLCAQLSAGMTKAKKA